MKPAEKCPRHIKRFLDAHAVLQYQRRFHDLTVDMGLLPFSPEITPFQIRVPPFELQQLTSPQAGGKVAGR